MKINQLLLSLYNAARQAVFKYGDQRKFTFRTDTFFIVLLV